MTPWRALSLVLTAAIGVLPMAPPGHVHDVHHDGHHATVAHRHAGGHDRPAAAAIRHHDDRDHDSAGPDGPEQDDHAGPDLAHSDSDHPDDRHHDLDHHEGLPTRQGPATSLDDDSVIALVTPIWTVPALDAPDAPATAVVAWILPPEPDTRVGHVDDVERSIHGPPRTSTSLRGPPVLSRL